MTSKENIIYYTITVVVFVGIVVCSLLFHNAGQPTNGDSERRFMTENISTIVVAISALATAGATIVLVFITNRYVRLTQGILKATNKPQVILFLRYSRSSISLCVQNIGTGYASDVEFNGNLSFKPTRQRNENPEEDKALKDIEPFKRGINYLGAGHKIDTFLCHTNQIRNLQNRSFKILVSYKDSANKPFNDHYDFDIGNWENTSQFTSPDTDDIASAIERVASNIENIPLRGTDSGLQNWAKQLLLEPLVETLKRIAEALERK